MSEAIILAKLDLILAILQATPRASTPVASGAQASDADLDSPHGNPTIKYDPKRWEGQSYVGSTYSETEPAYLDCLASFLDWKATANERDMKKPDVSPEQAKKFEKSAHFSRLDAARARGWAKRLRKRGNAPKGVRTAKHAPDLDDGGAGYTDPLDEFGGVDDIPFATVAAGPTERWNRGGAQ